MDTRNKSVIDRRQRSLKCASFFIGLTVVLALCLMATPALMEAWGLGHGPVTRDAPEKEQSSPRSPSAHGSADGETPTVQNSEGSDEEMTPSADEPFYSQTPPSARASDSNASVLDTGTFAGKGSATWSLGSDGVLTLSGSGEAALKIKWSKDNLSKQVKTIDVPSSSNIQPTLIDFKGFTNLTTANLSALDTSKTTDMHEAFYGDYSLTHLEVGTWKTGAVTNMEGMFGFCKKLTSITGINLWDTSNVEYMNNMFQECSALTSLDIASFRTTNLKRGDSAFGLQSMFTGCSSLTALNLSSWDVSAVANFDEMFTGCKALLNLDLSGWKTTNATSMFDLFAGCESLTSLNLTGFDTTRVSDMGADDMQGDKQPYGLFAGCVKLSEITLGQRWTFAGNGSAPRCMLPPAPSDANLWNRQWVRLNKGTKDNPQGPAYASDDLAKTYDGATMADTFIWQKKCSYLVHHYQVKASGEIAENSASEQEINAGAGDRVAAIPQDIEGYSYAPGFDNGSGSKEVQEGIASMSPKLELKLFYTANAYTLVFDKNSDEATGSMANQSRTYDDGLALSPNNYERKGFLFAGWNTQPQGEGGSSYDEGDTRSVTSEPDATVVLYAQWIPSYGLVINNEDENNAPLAHAGFELLDEHKKPLQASDFFSTADYLHPERRVPLSDWPIRSANDGKATVYGLVAATYYLKQISPAGYAPNSLDLSAPSTGETPSGYQNLLDDVKIVVDKTGNVTITTPDTTTQKKPDDNGNINLTITYIKPPDLPITGIFGTLSPLLLIQATGVFLSIAALIFLVHRRRKKI